VNEMVFLMLIQTICGVTPPLKEQKRVDDYVNCRKNVALCVASNRGSQGCTGAKYREWLKDTRNLGEI
jgi:hypothetical protein